MLSPVEEVDKPRTFNTLPSFFNLNELTRREIKSLRDSGLEHAAILKCRRAEDLKFFLQTVPTLRTLYLYCSDLKDPLCSAFSTVMPRLMELTIAEPKGQLHDLDDIARCVPFLEVLRVGGTVIQVIRVVQMYLQRLRVLRFLPTKSQGKSIPYVPTFDDVYGPLLQVQEVYLDVPLNHCMIKRFKKGFPNACKRRAYYKGLKETFLF